MLVLRARLRAKLSRANDGVEDLGGEVIVPFCQWHGQTAVRHGQRSLTITIGPAGLVSKFNLAQEQVGRPAFKIDRCLLKLACFSPRKRALWADRDPPSGPL